MTTTLTTHTTELVEWLAAHGATPKPHADHNGPQTLYSLKGVSIIVRDELTGYTPDDRTRVLLAYAPGWCSFDIETPFPIVVAAVKAAIKEAGQ